MCIRDSDYTYPKVGQDRNSLSNAVVCDLSEVSLRSLLNNSSLDSQVSISLASICKNEHWKKNSILSLLTREPTKRAFHRIKSNW